MERESIATSEDAIERDDEAGRDEAAAPTETSVNLWEEFYSSGEYKFLESPAEIGRFGVIAEIICMLPGKLNVLDIGCGLGHLCRLLPENKLKRYLGIDISPKAIAKAQENYPQHTFLCTDIKKFTPDTPQDVVVISCVLELLYDIEYRQVIENSLALLSPAGILIVTVYSPPQGGEVVEYLKEHKHVQKHLEVISHDSNLGWHVLTISKS